MPSPVLQKEYNITTLEYHKCKILQQILLKFAWKKLTILNSFHVSGTYCIYGLWFLYNEIPQYKTSFAFL